MKSICNRGLNKYVFGFNKCRNTYYDVGNIYNKEVYQLYFKKKVIFVNSIYL